jgi:hypothetical protein
MRARRRATLIFQADSTEAVMTGAFRILFVAFAVCSVVSSAVAGDADVLASFAGSWSGEGKFRLTTGSSPVTVSCAMDADASPTSLSMDGKCRGMVVVSRKIGVTLKADGAGFSGSYVGSTTGPAGLSGALTGDAFDLSIRWAKAVNGDREAQMKVEKIGENGMKLTTVDVDPKTGEQVVTCEISLLRS